MVLPQHLFCRKDITRLKIKLYNYIIVPITKQQYDLNYFHVSPDRIFYFTVGQTVGEHWSNLLK